jgi:hypothetical protein
MTPFDPYKFSDASDDDEVLPETQDTPQRVREFSRIKAEIFAEMAKIPLQDALPNFLRRGEELIRELDDETSPFAASPEEMAREPDSEE